MAQSDDFASLMEASTTSRSKGRADRRLRPGETVEGTVVQIGKDSVFVDVGGTSEARIERSELADKQGNIHVKVGDLLRASVASVGQDGPLLVLSVGRGQRGGVDLSMLQNARDSKLPVQGKVSRAVKGGVEVDIAGVRAFCPASQVSSTYIADLATLEGQVFDFLVVEIKEDGRSVVLSRRALLEEEKARAARTVLDRIAVGGEYEGTVNSLQKYGAFIDLGGGVEGLVHVSELAHSRVERVEDVLSVGDRLTVRVLAIEPQDKSPIPKLRLSVRAMQKAPDVPTFVPDEVLSGTVSKVGSFGVRVETPKGTGLVPLRELGIPRGSDYRKAFPIGKEVKVVLVHGDASGRITFSFARVAGVEESANYREFTRSAQPTAAAGLGSLGLALQQKLGLPEPVAPVAPPPAQTREASSSVATVSPSRAAAPMAASPTAASPTAAPTAAATPKKGSARDENPHSAGVFKRVR